MRKAARSQHERFPAMKNDCERTNLIGSQVLKRYAKRGDRIAGNERRHIAPPVVPHVVNVAIAAIDVAAACDLDEDCVDLHDSVLAVMAVVRSVVSASGIGLLVADLVNKPGQGCTGH